MDGPDIDPLTVDFSSLGMFRIPLPKSIGCCWCKKRGTSEHQLKKCMGCGVAKYCSRQCQVAAWPQHKSECTSLGVAPITGPKAARTLTESYINWTDLHLHFLLAISCGLIRSNGGIEFNLTNSRSLLVTLVSHPESWKDGNPAVAFSIADARLEDKDASIHARAHWMGDRPQARARALEVLRSKDNPAVVGLIPVTSLIPDQGMAMQSKHIVNSKNPYILPQYSIAEDILVDRYADLAQLSIQAINAGYVFRKTEGLQPDVQVPDVGRFSRRKRGGGWRWEPAAEAWGAMNLGRAPDMKDLWNIYSLGL